MRKILRLSRFTSLFLGLTMLLIILGSVVVYAAPVGPDNAPPINQKTALTQYGTGDQSNNQGCGPACAASAIAGVTGNGHTDTPPDTTLANDASAIGKDAGTKPGNGGGTIDENLRKAIGNALAPYVTKSRNFKVHLDKKPARKLIFDELSVGEQVMAGLNWSSGAGHWVVIQQANDAANPDGSNNVLMMDPWFGANCPNEIKAGTNAAGFLTVDMIGERKADAAGADTPTIECIIVISQVLTITLGNASTTVQQAQVTVSGGYTFVITGNVNGDVIIANGTVSGTTGTLYLVQGAPAYGLANGTVVIPPPGTLTPVSQLNATFNNFFVMDGPTLYTDLYPLTVPVPVGGYSVPADISVDKFGLSAPYIGLTSTIIVVAVATAIYVKRVRRRKEKQ